MTLIIRPFTEAQAEAVAGWTYEAPFDLYNGDPTDPGQFLVHDDAGFGYYALADEGPDGNVVGFCCFGPEARVPPQVEDEGVLDVGGGLRPDLVSQGLATAVFPAILDFGRQGWSPVRFRAAVASFNERSLRLCRSAGFEVGSMFTSRTGLEFLELLRSADE